MPGVAVVFVVGSTALALLQYEHFRFLATPAQFAVTIVAVVGLLTLGLTVLRSWTPPQRVGARAPRPVAAGAAAFGLSSLYRGLELVVPAASDAWAAVGCWAVLVAAAAVLLSRCSARPGWGRPHRLAVAGGALLTVSRSGWRSRWRGCGGRCATTAG